MELKGLWRQSGVLGTELGKENICVGGWPSTGVRAKTGEQDSAPAEQLSENVPA